MDLIEHMLLFAVGFSASENPGGHWATNSFDGASTESVCRDLNYIGFQGVES